MIPLAFSKAYKRGVVDKIPQMMPQTGNVAFRHGLFAGCCWNDCQTCMHVCCCPQARVAHTLKKAGIKPDTMDDLFVACCCTACGQCQEAMEIDSATGAHVSCCCSVQVDTVVEGSVVPLQVVGP